MDELSRKRLQKIILKEVAALSDDEKAFLRARQSYLLPSEKEKFASVLSKEVTNQTLNERTVIESAGGERPKGTRGKSRRKSA